MPLHGCQDFPFLNSNTQNAFSIAIIFGILTDIGTPGVSKSINNKLHVFRYKMYIVIYIYIYREREFYKERKKAWK